MATIIMRYIKGDFVVTGPDIDPAKVKRLIAIPAKVVVNPRASVTAGLAKEVEDVNQ